ncbi:MAG: hypothetical protein GQ570_11220 [Helicobacteraceae bacterium]|nr:hypothetical protein [Helicobacteraceae bacterium]
MPLIRQTVKSKYKTNDIVASDADLAIVVGMMEGIIETYDEKASGGTDITTPSTMNLVKISVSRPADKLSAMVSIPHLKPTKNEKDIFAQIALFDADYNSTLKATKIACRYNKVI